MGYPHPSHPKETVLLSKHFGDPEARTYAGWVKRGGYEGLRLLVHQEGIEFPWTATGRIEPVE